MAEVYVSTDVEADGPIPGSHSMLSFASAAFLADKTPVGTFSANLELLPGAAAGGRGVRQSTRVGRGGASVGMGGAPNRPHRSRT